MLSTLMLAQGGGDGAAMAGVMAAFFGVFCCAMIVVLAIQAVICYFVAGFFKAIPPEHRKQEPGMVWLLMIPIFGLVWNFFVFPRLSQSFQSYFAAQGRTDVGDCQAQMSLIYCILAACSIIPYLGALAGLAALVILIINLIKYNDLKKQITPTV